jgi:Fe-S-cluster-containing hydrogenase component 2
MTNNIPTKRAHTCAFCGPGITHIIDSVDYPNDWLATKQDNGKWKCGNCIEREIQDRTIKVTPNSDRAKEILTERKIKQQKELEFKRREAEVRKMHGRATV